MEETFILEISGKKLMLIVTRYIYLSYFMRGVKKKPTKKQKQESPL